MHHTSAAIIAVIRTLVASGVVDRGTLAAMQRAFVVAYARADRGTETAEVLHGVGNGLAGV